MFPRDNQHSQMFSKLLDLSLHFFYKQDIKKIAQI